MSHVKKQISIQAFIRGKVIDLLAISEVQYGDYLLQQGLAYLDEQLGGNIIGRELAANALFWAWWRNHWHDIDMEFVESVKHMSAHERQLYYEILHDHRAFEYRPQRAILQDAIKHINTPQIIKHQL
jgi:hypothetical protein